MKVNSKRQITLSEEICDAVNIKPGDEVEIMIVDGLLTVQKKLTESSSQPGMTLKDETPTEPVASGRWDEFFKGSPLDDDFMSDREGCDYKPQK